MDLRYPEVLIRMAGGPQTAEIDHCGIRQEISPLLTNLPTRVVGFGNMAPGEGTIECFQLWRH